MDSEELESIFELDVASAPFSVLSFSSAPVGLTPGVLWNENHHKYMEKHSTKRKKKIKQSSLYITRQKRLEFLKNHPYSFKNVRYSGKRTADGIGCGGTFMYI